MKHAVNDVVVEVSGQSSDHVSNAVGNLPFRGVIYYLVPERNFGVIVTADGLEIYFLRSSVINNDFDKLDPGSRVHFDLSSSILGLQARHVFYDSQPSACH